MAIVKEIKKGATTFIFCDDYCKDTTPEEAEAISRQIAKAVLPALRAAHFRGGRRPILRITSFMRKIRIGRGSTSC